jgi:hypothetical protein
MKMLVIAALLILPPVSLSGSQSSTSTVIPETREAFNQLTLLEKRAVLSGIASHRLSVKGAKAGELIGWGLEAGEETVRRDALEAFAGRAGGVAYRRSEATVAQWRADRPQLIELRERVVGALSDPSKTVREGAILALLNFDSGGSIIELGSARLTTETATLLSNRFSNEPEGTVRARIVFALAGAAASAKQREDDDLPEPARSLVIAALDQSDSVVSLAPAKDADTASRPAAAAQARSRRPPPASQETSRQRERLSLSSSRRCRAAPICSACCAT